MVQTKEASLVCHAPEAEPFRSGGVAVLSHTATGEVQGGSVGTYNNANAAAPVEPGRTDAEEHAADALAAAGGGEEEGGWGGGAVGLNFTAAGAGSSRK